MDLHMLVVQGKPHGKFLHFGKGQFVFGRGPECHVRPNSEWVSRQHCMLHVSDGSACVRDLGSTNGTLVNGTRILDECPLQVGDQLQVGPLVFQVVDREDASDVPDTPTELPAYTPQNETRELPQAPAETVEAGSGA